MCSDVQRYHQSHVPVSLVIIACIWQASLGLRMRFCVRLHKLTSFATQIPLFHLENEYKASYDYFERLFQNLTGCYLMFKITLISKVSKTKTICFSQKCYIL